MNTALVFIFSPNVGPYISAISYLHDKHAVSGFKFIFLVDTTMGGPSTGFTESIISTFEDLATNAYLGAPVQIDSQSRDKYASIATLLRAAQSTSSLVEVVSMEALSDLLTRKARQVNPGRLFIDVTGLPKNLVAQVMILCLVDGHQAYAFELTNSPANQPKEELLYFSLPPDGFNYSSLTRDPAVLASLGKLVHVRNIMRIAAIMSTIGVFCFSALLILDSNSIAILLIGLIANIIGIFGGITQAISMRS